MSKFDDFVVKQKEHNQATSDALTDLAGDVKGLSDLVESLRNAQGTLTPAQQAVLDELDTAGKDIADKATALANVTPPAAPPVADDGTAG